MIIYKNSYFDHHKIYLNKKDMCDRWIWEEILKKSKIVTDMVNDNRPVRLECIYDESRVKVWVVVRCDMTPEEETFFILSHDTSQS